MFSFKFPLTLFFSFILSGQMMAQSKLDSLIESCSYHAMWMDADTTLELRQLHFDSFQYDLSRIQTDSFAALQYIPDVLYTSDENENITLVSYSFRIHSGLYYYYLLFIDTEGQIHQYQSEEKQDNLSKFSIYSFNQWYGALYFNVVHKKVKRKDYYFLFGYRDIDHLHNEKFIDILYEENGQWILGKPGFFNFESAKSDSRYPIVYSELAAVKLNYDKSQNLIIQDNLISFMTEEGPQLVPDGSYIGMKWKHNKWEKVDKVYHQVSEEAPRPQPILEGKKDLFGQKN